MKDTKELIEEEQRILNNLIHKMDNEMLELDTRLTRIILEAKKAQEKCLPDTYGVMVQAADERIKTKEKIQNIQQSKDELYDHRIIVEAEDEDGTKNKIELKIGLHTYAHGKDIFVCSWKRPVCRHYILDNTAEIYEGVVEGINGEKYHTTYHLKLKRKIELRFTKVKNVTHLFPIKEESAEQIVADEFLQELLNRRSGQEFRNIVFSIQKQQGIIIQCPFKQNIIVQGCAGSGKSMIMLHRLPIILYDNPNSLDRNNLYIITPSLAYIQMAENMRQQLEISDLKMGTLEQYYDFVLNRYGRKVEEYGKISYEKNIPYSVMEYVYSDDCINDICTKIEELIEEQSFDFSIGNQIFNLSTRYTKQFDLPSTRITSKILESQTIIMANQDSLRKYHKLIHDTIAEMDNIDRMLSNRKISILRSILKKQTYYENEIKNKTLELKNLDKELKKVAYKNRLNAIEAARNRIKVLNESQKIIDNDIFYFEKIDLMKQTIEKVQNLFSILQTNFEDNTWDEIYTFISEIYFLSDAYNCIYDIASQLEDKYTEYVSPISDYIHTLSGRIMNLKEAKYPLLERSYFNKLIEINSALSELQEKLPQIVYFDIMKKLGHEPNKKGKITGISCSPYLFLQIIYQFQGVPKATNESLITIDEAQGLAVNEFLLIKNVNDNKVIFNLFGDEKQHIEGTKGIDSWSQLEQVAEFDVHNMLQNYRNARQITNYCNQRFAMNMEAINLDGGGVHTLQTAIEFNEKITELFLNVRHSGISAIIVKDKLEAKFILKEYKRFKNKINDMTSEEFTIHHTKWNLMTVDEVKGLEFGTVIGVTGRMTQNEKYITYTRALDELFVYDEVFEIPKNELSFIDENKEVKNSKKSLENHQTKTDNSKPQQSINYTQSEVSKFFKKAGLEVNDMRANGGYMWVLGDKSQIDNIVKQACSKFNISGIYSAGKATKYKPGWYTKTKK